MENRKRYGSELNSSDKKKIRSDTGSLASELAARKEAIKQKLAKHALTKDEQHDKTDWKNNSDKTQNNLAATNFVNGKSSANSDLLEKIRNRKAVLNEKRDAHAGDLSQANFSATAAEPIKPKHKALGLNAPVHPLLFKTEETAETTSIDEIRTVDGQSKNVQRQKTFKSNPYLEHSIPDNFDDDINARKRRSRGLVFNQKGKFIHQAEELRRQAKLEELKRKVEEKKKENNNFGIDILAGEREYKRSEPPSIEWWDEKLVMKENTYSELDSVDPEINPKLSSEDSDITEYILHPIPIPPPWEKHLPKQMAKLHLTKREIKQIRKRERSEKHKEKQDRIRLGLDPAPPPKVKPSNVMSIYTDEAIRDPTAMEMKARQEVGARKEKHESDNNARKLTREQRHEKEQAKIDAQKEKGLFCAVFRVENLSDRKHKFLININAVEYKLTGITIFNDKFNLILVEGGFIQVKKYTHLLLDRVKWTENAPMRTDPSMEYDDKEIESPQDLSHNKCSLIWKGQIKNTRFLKWSQFYAETEKDAKDVLEHHGVGHFWVEARSLTI